MNEIIETHGIHHITAIAGAPQENVDFYVGTLGMRLVKRSINQDAPDTYHLFFADGAGNPGTDLTFFPWPAMGPHRSGAGTWGEVSLTVPAGSLDFWRSRLEAVGVAVDAEETRFGEQALPFRDPHGMPLALVESRLYDEHPFRPWAESPVPAEHQVRALGSVRLVVHDAAATVAFLSESLGFAVSATDGPWTRYAVGQGLGGQRIDVRVDPAAPRGTWGVGAVHHVAFRVANDEDEREVQSQIARAGGRPTEVIDRFWFKSVYVREPSGALCEVATDGPGFAVDEDANHLGEALVLPPWYESQRDRIEAGLVPITIPGTAERDAV